MKKIITLAVAPLLLFTAMSAASAKSADASETLPPPAEGALSLSVDVRSAHQAVITLIDTRLPDIISHIKEKGLDSTGYYDSFEWTIRFGENGDFSMKMHTTNHDPDKINTMIEPTIADFVGGVPIVASRRPHRPYENELRLEYHLAAYRSVTQTETGFVCEVSLPVKRGIDFTSDDPFIVSYPGMVNGVFSEKGQDKITITYAAADVVDMRNFGQEYDINFSLGDFSESGFEQMVYGMTHEQSDQLYFTPPETRYAIATARIPGTWTMPDGSSGPFDVEFTELISFDESGAVTGITGRLYGEGLDNWYGGVHMAINALHNGVGLTRVKLVESRLEDGSYNEEGAHIGYLSFIPYYYDGNNVSYNDITIDDYLYMLEADNDIWTYGVYTIVERHG